jgi:hypothetical protein
MLELIAIGVLLLGGWCISSGTLALVRGQRSRTWPTTPGVVESANVRKKLNSEGDEVSRQELEYSYVVGGKKYRSSRVRFGLPRGLTWTAQPIPMLRRGDHVPVFHNPSRPSLSTLQPGASPFVVVLMTVGGVILWLGMRLLLS